MSWPAHTSQLIACAIFAWFLTKTVPRDKGASIAWGIAALALLLVLLYIAIT